MILSRRSPPTEAFAARRESPASEPLRLALDSELSLLVRSLALAQGRSPEALAHQLLAQALEHERQRARADAILARLTPRQREVTKLALDGNTNYQIANALVISPETVKTHVAHVLEQFGLRSKAELRLRLAELDMPEKPARPPSPSVTRQPRQST